MSITITQHSKNPNKNANGGEYDFGYKIKSIKGVEFKFQWTSAEFDFCEFSGNFNKTKSLPQLLRRVQTVAGC